MIRHTLSFLCLFGCILTASPCVAIEVLSIPDAPTTITLAEVQGPLISTPVWEKYSLRPKQTTSVIRIPITQPTKITVAKKNKSKKVKHRKTVKKKTVVATVTKPVIAKTPVVVPKVDHVQEAINASSTARNLAITPAVTPVVTSRQDTSDNVSASWIIRRNQKSSDTTHRLNYPGGEKSAPVASAPQTTSTATAPTTEKPVVLNPVTTPPKEQVNSPFIE